MSLTVRGPAMSSAGLRASYDSFERSVSRMSSGLRITRAADDASGLSISEGLRSRMNGSAIAARNVQDGIGMLQTAEGGLTAITSMLQRARDLAVQAANGGSLDTAAREAIAAETRQLVAEIDRTARATASNGTRLLDGSRVGGFVFQVGAEVGDTLSVASSDVRAQTLGLLGATATTMTTLSSTTTYTTRSGALPANYTTDAKNRDFTFSIGGAAPITVKLDNNKAYAGNHAQLASDLQAKMTEGGVAASVRLATDASGNAVLEFVAADPTRAVDITGTGAAALGIGAPDPSTSTSSITTHASAAPSLIDLIMAGSQDAITLVDDALKDVLRARSELGAVQNRMEHRLSILATTGENLAAARTRIADADMAQEYAGLVRAQLLTQVGTAIQAQEAQSGQRVLQLLTSR